MAYEVSQAMTFEVHESIINYYFYELKKEPMEGFSAVTLQQVAAADRELHVRLAEATRAGFRNGPNGELPLDVHVKNILEGPEIRWMLMPMPKRSVGRSAGPEPPKPKNEPNDPKRERTEPKKTRENALKLKRLKKTPMPKQLVGCVPCTEEGQAIMLCLQLGLV